MDYSIIGTPAGALLPVRAPDARGAGGAAVLLVLPGWQLLFASRQPAQVRLAHLRAGVAGGAQPVQFAHTLLLPPQVASTLPGWQVLALSQHPFEHAHGATHAPAMQS